MENKLWYTSKTLWVNVIAIAGVISSNVFGYTISAEMAVSILSAINIFLRFITGKPIVWEK